MRGGQHGMTLIEVLAASLVLMVIVGGTMTAFVTAADIVRHVDIFAYAEASGLARESIEKLRNGVAQDLGLMEAFASAGTWQPDPWVDPALVSLPGNPHRCYQVTQECGGTCYQVQAVVCWNNETSCPC